jgi:thiamine-phosphate pyrophosphorylase
VHHRPSASTGTPLRFPSPLYAIIDADAARPLMCLELAQAVLAAGCRVVQLRMKDRPASSVLEVARAVRALARPPRALLIINDRADIAMAAGADGVHLGPEDLPVAAARRLLGPRVIVGRSTHSLEEARAAAADGADYVGFGPIFPTATKSLPFSPRGIEALREVCTALSIPVVAIGGITEATAQAAYQAGAAAVAMIRDIGAAPDPTAKVRRLLELLAPAAAG